MTDYSVCTDEQVNEAIAQRIWAHTLMTFKQWDDILARSDYTHDWRLAGELLEEMNASLVWLGDCWGVFFGTVEPEAISESENPKRAICEAWLVWKEQG